MPIDPLPVRPKIVSLNRGIREISARPICDFCTRPNDVIEGNETKIVAFDTYAELSQHRRNEHPYMKANGLEPNPVTEIQISKPYGDDEDYFLQFTNASIENVNSWVTDLKLYLDTRPDQRILFRAGGNTKNLRPIDGEQV